MNGNSRDREGITGYPLVWPDGWPRTDSHRRKSSKYKIDLGGARSFVYDELRRARASHVIVSSNVPLNSLGQMRLDTRQPADPGVAVYWEVWKDLKSVPLVIACDSWTSVRENLRAVGLAIESLRQLERCGATSILERAYTGFARLPAGRDWLQVFGLQRGATTEQIKQAYRKMVVGVHPDNGGSPERFREVQEAYENAIREAQS